MTEPLKERAASLIEMASKSVGVVLAVAYVAGFLIVALHHARFGIAEFSPLKPKVFAAGVLFLLLSLVPSVGAWRWSRHLLASSEESPESRRILKWRKVENAISFFLFAQVLALPWLFLFSPGMSIKVITKPLWWFAGWAALYLALIFVHRRFFHRVPILLTLLSFIGAVGFFAISYILGSRESFWLSLWFYLVGVATIAVLHQKADSTKLAAVEWERWIPAVLLFPLSIFAAEIYGTIKSEYGGAAPRPVKIYLGKSNPISISPSDSVLLVEETEHGYYVKRTAEEKKLYFLKRDTVEAIQFDTSLIAPSQK